MSIAATIPFAGWGATGGKFIFKYGDEAAAVGKAFKFDLQFASIKTLQTGGNTLKNSTLKALDLTAEQGKRAIEALKKAEGLSNNFHQKILSNGDVVNSATGKVLGNLYEYLP